MTCPECGSNNVYVNDTLPGEDNHIYRRRKCRNCGYGFRSMETIIEKNGPHDYSFYKADRDRHPKKNKNER